MELSNGILINCIAALHDKHVKWTWANPRSYYYNKKMEETREDKFQADRGA